MSHKKKCWRSDNRLAWFLSLPSLIGYLENLRLEDILSHTEYNVHGCKIYGNLLKCQQDWIEVRIEDCIFQVQCLIF